MDKIVISTSSFQCDHHAAMLTWLRKHNLQIVMNSFGRKCTKSEIIELLDEKVIGLVAGVEPLDQEVLQQSKNLKVISRCGVGLDNVDLITAKRQNIQLYNTPTAPVDAVAELTLALMLNLLRHVTLSDQRIRQGQWTPVLGNLLSEQTIGIIGYGRIGRKVASLLKSFGSRILVYDTVYPQQSDVSWIPLETLLSEANIVSLHVPSSSENYHFLDESRLNLLRAGSFLINTSRGDLIDEEALYRKLVAKKIAGAALDTFSKEPYCGPLASLPNVLLTPHIGSYAREARLRMEAEALRHLSIGLAKIGRISSSE